jgi:activator of HSP90 ATPase
MVQYEWSLTTASSPAVNALYALAKAKLPGALETKFAAFPGAMLDTHGRDLQVGTPSASGTSTPVPAPTSSAAAPAPASSAQATAAKKALNTSTVKVDAAFMAAADDLYSLLTDPARVPSWSRAPASGEPKAGTEYSLFGGGVKGKYVELEPAKKIVQTWALSSPSWPAGESEA